MATTDLLELRLGSSQWIRVCHRLVSLLGLIALAMSPISSGWLGVAVGALCLVHVLTAWRMGRAAGSGRLVLQGDGDAMLFAERCTLHARYRGAGWASRWLCVLALERLDDGNPLRCVVCRSQNSPDAWRRLLVRLRADRNSGREPDPGWT